METQIFLDNSILLIDDLKVSISIHSFNEKFNWIISKIQVIQQSISDISVKLIGLNLNVQL
jgi:hypothetical protein